MQSEEGTVKKERVENLQDKVQELRRLCAANAHAEADMLFQQLHETLKCSPRIALLMAKSLTSRSMHIEAGKVLASAVQENSDNVKLGLRYIQNLLHTGNIAEATQRLPALLEEGLDADDTLALARAFGSKGQQALAASVIEQCADKETDQALKNEYARLTSGQDTHKPASPAPFLRYREKMTGCLYKADLQGAQEELEKYIAQCGDTPSIEELCEISRELLRLDNPEKALVFFGKVIERLGEQRLMS